MYEQFYRLKKAPFHITPDPEFLFLSPTHKEALASIVYGVEKRKGFVVVVGEVGLGKTTVLRSYLDRADKKLLRIIYVFNPNVPFSALLDTIDQAAGLDIRPDTVAARVLRLHDVLVGEYKQGYNIVLVVDEAQNMPIQTLEDLRLLSNLETSKDKLLQIVLVGQPEFDTILDRHELRQLKQRIAIRSTLTPLSADESLAYIRYRLEKAGAESADIFTRGALRRIVRHAKGIPRLLNIVCDNALMAGLGYQKKPVTAAIVREVIADFKGKRRSKLWRWEVAALAALLVVGGLFLWSPPIHQAPAGLEKAPPASLPQRAAAGEAAAPSPAPAAAASPVAAQASPVAANPAPAPPAPVAVAKSAPPAAAKAPATRERAVVATRVVEPGDTLYRLTASVYGAANEMLLDAVKRYNPKIKNINHIPAGTRIRFPEIP